MLLLLLWNASGQPAQLLLHALDLLSRGSALLVIQLGRRTARQPPRGPAHYGRGHLQISQQRGG
jgi:hypothetical protein